MRVWSAAIQTELAAKWVFSVNHIVAKRVSGGQKGTGSGKEKFWAHQTVRRHLRELQRIRSHKYTMCI